MNERIENLLKMGVDPQTIAFAIKDQLPDSNERAKALAHLFGLMGYRRKPIRGLR